MATEFIQKVVEATGGKDRSISWFQNKIREFGSPTSAQLIREGKRRSTPFFGKLNMFFYSPKYKDKLPYYDRFPLVLPLESFRGGFLGINLHYLPIPLRTRLLDRLYEFSSNDKFDSTTRLTATYNSVKNISLVKPTIKKYLYPYVQTGFLRINADEAATAIYLPVQRFKKASEARVYADSRRFI